MFEPYKAALRYLMSFLLTAGFFLVWRGDISQKFYMDYALLVIGLAVLEDRR